jgi:hypothetical protein
LDDPPDFEKNLEAGAVAEIPCQNPAEELAVLLVVLAEAALWDERTKIHHLARREAYARM